MSDITPPNSPSGPGRDMASVPATPALTHTSGTSPWSSTSSLLLSSPSPDDEDDEQQQQQEPEQQPMPKLPTPPGAQIDHRLAEPIFSRLRKQKSVRFHQDPVTSNHSRSHSSSSTRSSAFSNALQLDLGPPRAMMKSSDSPMTALPTSPQSSRSSACRCERLDAPETELSPTDAQPDEVALFQQRMQDWRQRQLLQYQKNKAADALRQQTEGPTQAGQSTVDASHPDANFTYFAMTSQQQQQYQGRGHADADSGTSHTNLIRLRDLSSGEASAQSNRVPFGIVDSYQMAWGRMGAGLRVP